MNIQDTINNLKQIITELEEFATHECFDQNTEVKLIFHDPKHHIVKQCNMNRVNVDNLVHSGRYQNHLFLDFEVGIDVNWHLSTEDSWKVK